MFSQNRYLLASDCRLQPNCQKHCLQNMKIKLTIFPSLNYLPQNRPYQAWKIFHRSLPLRFLVHKKHYKLAFPISIKANLCKGEDFFSFQSSIWRPCSHHAGDIYFTFTLCLTRTSCMVRHSVCSTQEFSDESSLDPLRRSHRAPGYEKEFP